MTKRYLLPVAICFLFGIIISLKEYYWILVPFGILVVYIFLRFYKYNMKVQAVCFSGLLFCVLFFGILIGENDIKKMRSYERKMSSGQKILVQGRLYKKETKSDRVYLYLDKGHILLDGVSVSCCDILVIADDDNHILGNTLVVSGIYDEFTGATNEGNYDEREVFYSKGIDIRIRNPDKIEEYGRKIILRELLYRVSKGMKAVMESHLNEENASTLAAIVLGDKTDLSADDKNVFRKAGLSHILTVSGLHVSMLCMFLYELLRKLKLPVIFSVVMSAIFSVIYCLFTGAGTSTVRAVGMFIVSMVAVSLGEAYDLLSALSLLAIIISANNPRTIFSAGFILSFLAVLGIAVTGKVLQDSYALLTERRDFVRKIKRRIGGKTETKLRRKIRLYFENFISANLINVGIFVTTIPAVSWYYFEIPILSLITNILVLPFMGLLLGLGFFGSLFGMMTKILGYTLFPCGLIIDFIRKTAGFFMRLSFSNWIIGRPHFVGVVLYYFLLGEVLWALKMVWKKICDDSQKNKEPRRLGEEEKWCRKLRITFLVNAALIMAVLPLILTCFVINKPDIKMLDVGQGDGIYIKTDSGADVFIDGGSSSINQVGTYRILPFLKYKGVGSIEYWFVSHPDDDHVNGLMEIIAEGYKVKTIVFSNYVVRNDNYEEIIQLCKSNNINVLYLKPDDTVVMGNDRCRCLYPNIKMQDTNVASMVLFYVTDKYEFLLTGDMGKSEEKHLLESFCWPETGKARILKIAHHGSKNSSEKSFIEMCSPDIALISAGKNNSYGHPHKETLDNLKETLIKRTDIEGEICISNVIKDVNINARD